MLRRSAAKRPPQHSDKRIWCGFGVQTQAFSLECPHGFGSEARIRFNSGLGGGKWEMSDSCRMPSSHALGPLETVRIRGLIISGWTVVGLLCCLTGVDFLSYRSAFPLWFTPVFLGGIITLLLVVSANVRWLWIASPPLALQDGPKTVFMLVLLPVSFFCTSSVHRFFPFRFDLAEIWMTGNNGSPISFVLKFNYVLTAVGVVVMTALAIIYALRWRRTALVGLLVFAGVLLVPNDDCGNAFNLRWIRMVGASPLMFIPNVVVILLAAAAFLGIRATTACVTATMVCLSTLVLGLGHLTGIIW